MSTATIKIILFISMCCLCHTNTAAAGYKETCGDSSGCIGSHLECINNSCSCTGGYVENSTANGCSAALGSDCTTVNCYDTAANCDSGTCECKSTHYDDNGNTAGGSCVLKITLGGECPNPSAGVAVTCAALNSACSADETSSTNYTCQCSAPYVRNMDNCVVDGQWGAWSGWTNCPVSCGGGTQRRTRNCDNPLPQNGGTDCGGQNSETQNCNTDGCPVDGQWGAWSGLTNCSVSCGGGTQSRTRNCDNPQPQNNGAYCVGQSSQSQDCNTNGCPVDGGWTAWTSWSSCTVSCAGGAQTRNRSCTNPAPQNDGLPCSGSAIDRQTCNSETCPVVLYGDPCTPSGDKCAGGNTECSGGTCQCVSGFYWSGSACVSKVGLGYSCPSDIACKTTNAVCTGGKCTCNSQHFDDNGSSLGGICRTKVELGSTGCSVSVDSCKSPNAYCQYHGGPCRCNIGYYDSNGGGTGGGTCTQKVELGSHGCSTKVSDSCKSQNAQCQSGGYCTCNNGYYDNNGGIGGGTCTQKKGLGEQGCSTSVTDSCNDVKSRCSSNGGYCTCLTGYYDSNGNVAGGTCESDKGLGKACTGKLNECADSAAQCLDGKCTCGDNYYDTNGLTDGGNCVSVSELKVLAINFPSASIGTSGFQVSWTPPTAEKASQISSYVIDWKLKTQDNNLAGGNEEVSNTRTSLMIRNGVTSGKTYIVIVTSKNIWTQLSTSRTTSLSKEQAAKPNIPRSLTTPDLNAKDGTIRIGWSAPASGVASGYKIRLLDGSNEITSVERSSSPVSLSNSSIENGYRYNITIQARSEAYDDTKYVWSDLYKEQIKTVVQEPSEPRSVHCDTVKDESITLTWMGPVFPNGDLVRYIIRVLNANQQLLFNRSTTQVVERHTVISLSPGTTYWFRVFTVNEKYTSTDYGQPNTSCMTKAKLSDPPSDLKTTALSSRNITITWNEPNNTHSEENYGYVIQLTKDDVCVKEVVYRCSNCRGTFQISNLTNMCDNSNLREIFTRTRTELSGLQSYQFINLTPDTTFTISGTAVNNLGRGNLAEISETTAEEAPQTPYNVEVSDIGTTSFTVTWNIDGPRPGKTNFTVTLIAVRPAPRKDFTFTGFTTRSHRAEGLEEYWNYSVSVTATTSVGAKTSVVTQEYRTLPAAPGEVSNFDITTAPDGNYTRMQITWNAPTTLLQNGVIETYSFFYYISPELKSGSPTEMFEHKSLENHEYEVYVDVVPEVSYTFEVYGTNQENMTGETRKETIEAPAGVPINIEKTLQIDIIPKKLVKNEGQERFTITVVPEFFTETTYGEPKGTGLTGCGKKNCDFSGIKKLEDWDTMDNWNTASKNGFDLWRMTNSTWLSDLQKKQANSRRKRSTTQLDYTVGSDDCSQVQPGEYCNGPLQPGTSYTIVAVSCTSGGCLVSKEYGPFVTLAVPDDENNLPMIIGIVVAVVVVVIGAVVGFVLLRRRNSGPGKMKPASESDDDEFTTVDPAVAKIPRKRPIVLEEIEEYVNKMHKDSNLLFSAEYEDLKTLSPKHACEAADREENRMRNRYINIIPFDHTRVKLSTNGEDDSSDYINANYLPGYSSPREYIGCQGPIPGTIDDFWRMTWEQNVSVVVMLTLCKEGQKIKCEQYWPDEVGEPKQYGDVIVEITSYSNIRTYDYRMFKITNGSTTRVVKHFHFLSWLDFQANVHHDIILDFIQHVRQHVQPPDTSGPMIIHCSAGVGRTGTYIALDHLMQFINEHDFAVEIDIFDLVLKLRENRQHMVQTEQQYVFIHDCVKEIMDRKRRQMENIYENQAFSAQDENIYQNEQSLYENVSQAKSEQNTEL